MQHEEGNARQNPGRDEPEPLLPGADREPGPEGPGPERPGPGFEPHTLELGIFDRINNYLLLIYAGACLLMNYSLAGLLYFKGMIVLSLSLPGIFSIIFPFFFLSRRSMLGFAREFRFGALGVAARRLPIETRHSHKHKPQKRQHQQDAKDDKDRHPSAHRPKGPSGSSLHYLTGLCVVNPT